MRSFDLPNPIAGVALACPDRVVFKTAGRNVTAIELLNYVVHVARAFEFQGVKPKTVVGLCGEPSLKWFVCYHALGWIGATVAPLPRLDSRTPSADWEAQKTVLNPFVLINCDSKNSQQHSSELLVPDFCTLTIVRQLPKLIEGERFWPLDEVRWLVLSSGSYGDKRAIPITTGQIYHSAMASAMRLGHLPNDVWLCALPLHHVGGLSILARCAFYGTCVELHSRFDHDAISKRLDSGEISHISLVPTMLRRLLDFRQMRAFNDAIRCMLIGGAPCDKSLLEDCQKIGAKIAVTWGMTESASQIATCLPGELDSVLQDSAVGPPLSHSRVESDSVSRRLVVKGPAVGGEYHTSDCGEVLDSGAIRITGRIDDVIISGGENVSLSEIESTIANHAQVCEVAVIGVSDATWGQRPVAFVATKSDISASLESWIAARLASHKRPSKVIFVDTLPRSSLGKVQKSRLRQKFENLGGR